MPRQIFVNLPIENMERSKAFFSALGFSFNPQFTNEQGACMVIEEDRSHAMLLVRPFFQTFTRKPVGDARASTQVLIALSCDSREEVDATVRKAVAAGGRTYLDPQDHGFMYSHAFEDLDGHQWEVFWMDPKAAPTQP